MPIEVIQIDGPGGFEPRGGNVRGYEDVSRELSEAYETIVRGSGNLLGSHLFTVEHTPAGASPIRPSSIGHAMLGGDPQEAMEHERTPQYFTGESVLYLVVEFPDSNQA